MGFFKKFGEIAGEITGTVLGGTVKLVGEVTNSEFVKEIGEGVYQTTKNSGKILGQAAEGTYTVAKGIIDKNEEKISEGFKDVGKAAGTTVVGIGKGMKNMAVSGVGVVDGLFNGDDEKTKNATKNLIKAAAVGAIGIGVLDGLDIIGDDISDTHVADINAIDYDDDFHSEVALDDVGNEHNYVDPHWVNDYTRSDGTVVEGYWRDGDGDTSHNLTKEDGGGYLRSNPDRA